MYDSIAALPLWILPVRRLQQRDSAPQKTGPIAVTEETGEFHGYKDGNAPDGISYNHETVLDVWKECQDRDGS